MTEHRPSVQRRVVSVVPSNHEVKTKRFATFRRRATVFLAATAAAATYGYGDAAVQIGKDILHGSIQTERRLQPDVGFANNGLIGITPSTVLPGVLETKYFNPESGWQSYNVIVPNTKANGITVNAEIFGSDVTMQQQQSTNGDVNFEIQYAPMVGIHTIDRQLALGNDAHFKVEGAIPHDKPEMTLWISPEEDSAKITEASLGNFYGALEHVDTVSTSDGREKTTAQYPDPDDGNLKGGDFYSLPLPKEGTVSFWKNTVSPTMVQKQEFTNGERLDIEVRRHEWRPEFGHALKPKWLETVRVWQRFKGDTLPKWKFSYKIEPPK